MSFSKSEWLWAAVCGLAGSIASLGAAVYHMETVPPLPRFFIFCVGAIAVMPGAIVAGPFAEIASTSTVFAVALVTSGLFWMWLCLHLIRRRKARRRASIPR